MKTLWQKEKLLIMSNSTFRQNVFKTLLLYKLEMSLHTEKNVYLLFGFALYTFTNLSTYRENTFNFLASDIFN